VPHALVPKILARFDIYVALSRLDSESFGVAILEASACGLPVVVSDADGPAEVVANGVTGRIIQRDNAELAGEAVADLVCDFEKRCKMGLAGRAHVVERYSWSHCIQVMKESLARLNA
jgi:glycosyltransferase involved in cell wall biosynthesis